MSDELKPCAHCGADPIVRNEMFLFYRLCPTKGCIASYGLGYENADDARDAWNTRNEDVEAIKAFINTSLTISLDNLDSFKRTGAIGDLGSRILNLRDTQEHLVEILGKIWALIYHGDTESWEYPGQILNHIRVELEARQKQIDELKSQSRWIPVSERVPDAMESVLVQFQDGEMTVTWRAPVRRISGFVEEWIVGNPRNVVIAWQPLPKAYGGKE